MKNIQSISKLSPLLTTQIWISHKQQKITCELKQKFKDKKRFLADQEIWVISVGLPSIKCDTGLNLYFGHIQYILYISKQPSTTM